MTFCILCQVCLLLSMLTDQIHAVANRKSKLLHFIIANRNGTVVTLPQSASVTELYGAVAESCNAPFPLELKLFGETILSTRSLTNQSLEEIPRITSIRKELDEIWGPGFRIPLTMHQILSSEHAVSVFTSLAQMFGGPNCKIHEFDWYQYVLYCLESRSCLIRNLCGRRFRNVFNCEKGELISLNLRGKRIIGYLNLSTTPQTIQKILVERSALTEIIGLGQLSGKQLTYLDIRENPLEIDLTPLLASSAGTVDNPLKVLRVNLYQISRSLVGKQIKGTRSSNRFNQEVAEVYEAAIRWVPLSTLNFIAIGARSKCRYIGRTNMNLSAQLGAAVAGGSRCIED